MTSCVCNSYVIYANKQALGTVNDKLEESPFIRAAEWFYKRKQA